MDIRLYPDFGQAAALAQGAVQSITGFINNEPVQLALQGIADEPDHGRCHHAAAGTGSGHRDVDACQQARGDRGVRRRRRSTRWMRSRRIQKGLDATFAVAPDLAADPTGQRAILDATIPLWTSDFVAAHGPGAIDTAGWQTSIAFMATLADSGVTTPIPVDQVVDASLVPLVRPSGHRL